MGEAYKQIHYCVTFFVFLSFSTLTFSICLYLLRLLYCLRVNLIHSKMSAEEAESPGLLRCGAKSHPQHFGTLNLAREKNLHSLRFVFEFLQHSLLSSNSTFSPTTAAVFGSLLDRLKRTPSFQNELRCLRARDLAARLGKGCECLLRSLSAVDFSCSFPPRIFLVLLLKTKTSSLGLRADELCRNPTRAFK